MTEQELLVPPIVENMLDGLKNKNATIWQRDSYAATLENIYNKIGKELTAFKKEKNIMRSRNNR